MEIRVIDGGGSMIVSQFGLKHPTTISHTNQDNDMNTLTLTSEAFSDGGEIPAKYTCDGQGMNPPLSIDGVDDEAKSLVIIMEDPDVPKEVREDQMFDHWVKFNIPPSIDEIPEDADPMGTLGQNTAGKVGYMGPCPPSEYEPAEHSYHFKLFVLDTTLDLPKGATKAEVRSAMEGHVLQQAELVGRYERK